MTPKPTTRLRRATASWAMVAATVVLASLLPRHAQAQCHPCPGDADGNQRVSVAELLTITQHVLNGCPPVSAPLPAGSGECTSCLGDLNRDGEVTIDEVVSAVSSALDGCPLSTTPTAPPTPTSTSVPTETAPAPTVTATEISIPSPTQSPLRSATVTRTITRSRTPTRTGTPSRTPTVTRSSTVTATATRTPTVTLTPDPSAPAIELLAAECEAVEIGGEIFGKSRYTVSVRNAPVGAWVSPTETRVTLSRARDVFDGSCRANERCVQCDDWSGNLYDWNGLPAVFGAAVRRADDPSMTTCTVSAIGDRVRTNGQPLQASVKIVTYRSNSGQPFQADLASTGTMQLDCPAVVGQVIPVTTLPTPPPATAIPNPSSPTPDTRTPTPVVGSTPLSSACEEFFSQAAGQEYFRTKVAVRVQGPVGTTVSAQSTFPSTVALANPDLNCSGNGTCAVCSGWSLQSGVTAVRGPGDPAEAECTFYDFAALLRFPLIGGLRLRLNPGTGPTTTTIPIECAGAAESVEALSAQCDYVDVDGTQYQRQTFTAAVAGVPGSSLLVWRRTPGPPGGPFGYRMPECLASASDPPCTPPEDCLVCTGWHGAVASGCPQGDRAARTSGDPLAAECTLTQYLSVDDAAASSEPVFLVHSHASTVNDRLELSCAPPP